MENIMPAPAGLVQQFDQYLHRHPLLPPKSRILVACSGGADSVALLCLLNAVNQSQHWKWTLAVGHVNHRLRGGASSDDERFVKRLGRRLKAPVYVRRLAWRRWDAAAGRVSEAMARTSRLAALRALARRGRFNCVALAHQADDQAETVLLRLLRGAGPRGLGGMALRRRMEDVWFVRPLLPWPREILRQWLRGIDQPWREDATNTDPRFLRNRIRGELMPLLATYQPNLRQVLGRMAHNQRGAYRVLRKEAALALRGALAPRLAGPSRRPGGREDLVLARRPLAEAADAVAGLALRMALRHNNSGIDRINRAHLLELVARLKDPHWRGALEFGGKITVCVQGARVYVRRTTLRRRKLRGHDH